MRRATSPERAPGRSTRLAWAMAVTAAALAMVEPVLLALDRTLPSGSAFAFPGFSAIVALTVTCVGVVLATRRPDNPIGWLFLASGLTEGFTSAAFAYATGALFGGRSWPGALGVAWLQTWVWLPAVACVTVFPVLRYPTGRLAGPRWVWASRLATAGILLASVGLAFFPGPIVNIGAIDNPLAVHAGWVNAVLAAGMVAFIGAIVLAASSLVVRGRRGSAVERLQVRWIAYAAGLAALFAGPAIVGSGLRVFSRPVTAGLEDALVISVLGIPVAIGVAILKYRLYDIDRIVSRTVSYALVTGCLFGVYVGCVALFTRVLPVNGDVGTAASVLVAVALFAPLRHRVQRRVDRRFNRARYDAEAAVAAFAGRLSEQVDLDAVRADLLGVVQSTVAPEHASLWVRGTQ